MQAVNYVESVRICIKKYSTVNERFNETCQNHFERVTWNRAAYFKLKFQN